MKAPLKFMLATLFAGEALIITPASAGPAQVPVTPDAPQLEPAPRRLKLVARLAGDGPRIVGGHLMLDVAIRNEGDRDVNLGEPVGPMSLIHIDVTYRRLPGHPSTPCQKTRFGNIRYAPIVDGRPSVILVQPGQEKIYQFPIWRMFDLSEEGIYSVNVRRRVSRWVGKALLVPEELRSDELTFTLTEP